MAKIKITEKPLVQNPPEDYNLLVSYDIDDVESLRRIPVSALKGDLNAFAAEYSEQGNIYTDGVLYPAVSNRVATKYIPFDVNCVAQINGVTVGASTLICSFYDENKRFISGIGNSATVLRIDKQNIPDGTCYVRFCKNADGNGTAIINKFDKLENDSRNIINECLSYDITFPFDGSYISASTGRLLSDSNYNASDYIKIVGKSISVLQNYDGLSGIAFYDINKNFIIGYSNSDGIGVRKTINVPNGSVYIRISNLKNNEYVTSVKQISILNSISNLPFIVTPEMYGAVGDGETNDATAIQNAISTGRKIVFENKTYCVNSEIVIDKDGTVIDCPGTIKVGENFAFNVKASHCNIYIHKIVGEDIPMADTLPYYLYKGGGFKLGLDSGNNDNVAYNEINVDVFDCLEYAIYSQPKSRTGVMYNKINFQYSRCNTTIALANRESDSVGNPWSNENYFNGSRVRGNTGIKFTKLSEYNSDYYNGNHFRNFGFEGIECGIDIEYAMNNTFENCRMAESLNGDYWIKCASDCVNNIFEVSNAIDSRRILDQHRGGFGSGVDYPNIYRMILYDGTNSQSYLKWNIGEAKFYNGYFYTKESSPQYRTRNIIADTWFTTKNYASEDVIYYVNPSDDIQLRLSNANGYGKCERFRIYLANNSHEVKLYIFNTLLYTFTSQDSVGMYEFNYINVSGVSWKMTYVG